VERSRPRLPELTICAADSANPALAARALAISLERCDFGDAILFTDAPVAGPFRTVLIEGRVQWRRGAQEGPSCSSQEVIAERIQVLSRSRKGALAAAGAGRVPAATPTTRERDCETG